MNSHHTDGTSDRHANTIGTTPDSSADTSTGSDVRTQASADAPIYDAMIQALAVTQPVSDAAADSIAVRALKNHDDPRGLHTGADAPVRDWDDHRYGRPSASPPVVDPNSPEGAAILSLFSRIKDIEEGDGSWPGSDVVGEVTSWLLELGIDPDQDPTDARRALRTALGERPGRGPGSTVYGVRIGTDHHDPESLIRTALHVLTHQLGPGTSVELVTHDRDLLARIEHHPRP
ncbi:hypothetical protein [Actinophytocola sediminis]